MLMPEPEITRSQSKTAQMVGQVYDLDGLRQLTSWNPAEIAERCKEHILLRLVTADGAVIYPASQFQGDQLRPTMARLLQVLLGSGVDAWTAALWLVTSHDELSSLTPIEWMRSQPADQELLAAAQVAAARWSA